MNPISATIKSHFAQGYIVELEDGTEAHLRLPELIDRERELHIAGNEKLMYGKNISVYLVYRDETYCSVSQLSPSERQQRQTMAEKKATAQKECALGDIYVVRVDRECNWGYLCSEIGGDVSGAIKKPTIALETGQHLSVVVVGKNDVGDPYFEPDRK